MLPLTAFVVAIVIFALLALHIGFWPTIGAALLATTIIIPRRLTNNSTIEYTGLAASAPEIYTYSIVIFGAGIVLLLSKRTPIPGLFAPFALIVVFLMAFSWSSTELVSAGLLQLALAVVAWGVGTHLGDLATRNIRYAQLFCNFIIVIISLETVVCLAQLAGLPLNALDPSTAALMGSRVNGTMNHPNNLGKVLLFLIILLIPFMRSTEKRIRARALTGTLLAFLPLALTGGRATFLAGLGVVVLTGVLSRGVKGRLALPLGVLLLVVPFLGSLWQRFEDDPEGGSRAYLLDIATRQIAQRPWDGIGPNSYVSIVGLSDALTATGLPVHNTFLLAAAELGVPAASALFLPLIIVLSLAWKSRTEEGGVGASAVAYLAAAPAWVLVAATGWGMLSTSIFPLWFFTLGFIAIPFLKKTGNRFSLNNIGTKAPVYQRGLNLGAP